CSSDTLESTKTFVSANCTFEKVFCTPRGELPALSSGVLPMEKEEYEGFDTMDVDGGLEDPDDSTGWADWDSGEESLSDAFDSEGIRTHLESTEGGCGGHTLRGVHQRLLIR
ncbi:unnamed protein product, partial [Ectocarpus sp. 12 AP-2014]